MSTPASPAHRLRLRDVVDTGEGIVIGAFSLLTPFLRGWRTRWGTRGDEASRALPGDDLIPAPRWSSTRAIGIRARADQVWPWLAQMGEGRGGLYSYDMLERLFGCDIRNTDQIIPALQNLVVGDGISLHPKIPALPVARIEPNRYLLLGNSPRFTPELEGEIGVSWLFYLDERPEGITRLITRWRAAYELTTPMRLGFGPLLVEPMHFTMERKMLLGIRARSERLAAES
jgi:hypothetical protein